MLGRMDGFSGRQRKARELRPAPGAPLIARLLREKWGLPKARHSLTTTDQVVERGRNQYRQPRLAAHRWFAPRPLQKARPLRDQRERIPPAAERRREGKRRPCPPE